MVCLTWIFQYPNYSLIEGIFGIEKSTINKLLDLGLPIISDFWRKFIPNKIENDMQPSSMSNLIIGVIDGTIHPISRPSVDQHLYYSGHYQTHGILSHFFVDFTGIVIAFLMNIVGRTNDSLVQTFNTFFHSLLNNNVNKVIIAGEVNLVSNWSRVRIAQLSRGSE